MKNESRDQEIRDAALAEMESEGCGVVEVHDRLALRYKTDRIARYQVDRIRNELRDAGIETGFDFGRRPSGAPKLPRGMRVIERLRVDALEPQCRRVLQAFEERGGIPAAMEAAELEARTPRILVTTGSKLRDKRLWDEQRKLGMLPGNPVCPRCKGLGHRRKMICECVPLVSKEEARRRPV